MAHTFFQSISDAFARYGYWAIFFGIMLENAGIPLPGETILLFAGFLAYSGEINLFSAMLVAIAGAVVGDSIGFLIGFHAGRPFVRAYIRKVRFLSKSFDRSEALFLKYGQWAVFGGRFIAGLRMFAGILAGVFRMPYWRFLFFNFTGAAAWAMAVTYIGFAFGRSSKLLSEHVKELDEIVLAVIVAAIAAGVIVYFVRRRMSRREPL